MATAPAANLSAALDDTEPWIRFGYRAVLGMLGGMIVLAAIFSIAGAVVASGSITVDGNYKTVQHLDGGIVAKIQVKNGDQVREGDVLVKLDDTQARATLGVTLSRIGDMLSQRARLEAERDGRDRIDWPAELETLRSDAAVARLAESQKTLFDARRSARQGETAMLRQRAAQLSSDIAGLGAQLTARRTEAELAAVELKNLRPLYDKGFISQQRMGPVQRDAARLDGEVGRLNADLSKAKSGLAEAELKIAQSEKEYIQGVVDELRKVQAQLSELEESRAALEDKLRRVVIRAPRTGRVHALAVFTEGGVVAPASPILQIIPADERLVVEARIQPQDIDKVHQGQAAAIRFPAFNARSTPRLEGKVTTVSAAQLTEQQTGRTYFSVQIEIPASEVARLGSEHTLVPGMPADVYIETGSRSILSYFVKPLGDVLARTFREQ